MKLTTKIALKILPVELWLALQFEWFLHKCNWQINSKKNKAKINKIKNLKNIKLHLGCGKKILPNWVNVDIYSAEGIDLQMNFRKPFPFENNSLDFIFSEHVLEHFIKPDAENILKECYRCLKKDGIFRIGVPDAEIYIRKYIENDKDYFYNIRNLGGAVKPLESPMDVINHMFRMGGHHLFAWDFETLQKSLEVAGFNKITKYESGISSIKELELDGPEHSFGTLYIEAQKA